MQTILQTKAKKLLETQTVDMIIGYSKTAWEGVNGVIFITKPEEAEKLVWDKSCINNLAVYLTGDNKKKYKVKGKIGIVLKGCDCRALIVLLQENQIKREDIHIIGIACDGVYTDPRFKNETMPRKCESCQVCTPPLYDTLIGEPIPAKLLKEEINSDLITLEEKSNIERWNFWQQELDKCIKCYACRNICPMCYCAKCFVDIATPQWVNPAASATGNLIFRIHRAFHLTARCIDCGECERACPVNIPLTLIKREMNNTVKELYDFVPGANIEDKPLFATYNKEDDDSFIR